MTAPVPLDLDVRDALTDWKLNAVSYQFCAFTARRALIESHDDNPPQLTIP